MPHTLRSPRQSPRRTVATFAVALAAVAIAGGCGDDESTDATPASSPTTIDASTTTDGPATTSPASTGASASTVTPSDPDLVVVDLADFSFDLTALDATPVANIYGPEFLTGVVDAFDFTADQRVALLAADNVAPAFELNVEAVLELGPDVILTSPSNAAFFAAPIEQLDAAVGVTSIDDDVTWQERSRMTATAAGLDGALDARIAAAEAAIADTAARVEALGLTGTEVSVIRSYSGALSALVPPSVASTTLATVGLTQPDAQLVDQPEESFQPDYAAEVPIAPENLEDHDADALIMLNTVDTSSPTAEWPDGVSPQLLPVLERGPAIATGYFAWSLNTVTGVEAILADINRLLDELAATP